MKKNIVASVAFEPTTQSVKNRKRFAARAKRKDFEDKNADGSSTSESPGIVLHHTSPHFATVITTTRSLLPRSQLLRIPHARDMAFQQEAVSHSILCAGSAGTPSHFETANTPIVTTTIAYPLLKEATAESVHFFLGKYDDYVRELASHASQVTNGSITTEADQPVTLKYCVDQQYVESLLALGFIPGVETYEDLQDADPRSYLETQARASKQAMTIDKLDRFVKADLRINMRDENSVSRTRNLFVSYHALLRTHNVSWVIQKTAKSLFAMFPRHYDQKR